ncbi:hypothetical protein K7X08_035712 [Anisodus acutangulus]|uniref:Uncharacterized protein n=1 Tax=Anisodus acutangulus TaxID=402998 RepID=A0A9Q1M6J3_9SOLA|nr:hypothetical protein K7X08_035712 [Anisodus acutangulus]
MQTVTLRTLDMQLSLGEGDSVNNDVVDVEGVKKGVVVENVKVGKELVAATVVQETVHVSAEPAIMNKGGGKPLNVHSPVYTPGKKAKSPTITKQWVDKSFSKHVGNLVQTPFDMVVTMNHECEDVPSTTFVTVNEIFEKAADFVEVFRSDVGLKSSAIVVENSNGDNVQRIEEAKVDTIEDNGTKVLAKGTNVHNMDNTASGEQEAIQESNPTNLQVALTNSEEQNIDLDEESIAHNFNYAARDGDLSPTQVAKAMGKTRKKSPKDTTASQHTRVQTKMNTISKSNM